MILRRCRIRSHAGLARYLSRLSDEPVRWIARCQIEDLPTPYRYSPVVPVYQHDDGDRVFWLETSHRVYDVFTVEFSFLTFATEGEAEHWHVRYCDRRTAAVHDDWKAREAAKRPQSGNPNTGTIVPATGCSYDD